VATIRVQTDDFSIADELAVMRQDARIGAVASFVGLVRDVNDGTGVSTLTLEHYPAMTEKSLAQIVAQAEARWRLIGVTVIHRVGELKPTDQIVLVLVGSAHRGDAFAACEFIMDYLKTDAPFWKKEVTPSGERWVDARETDHASAARWRVTGTDEKAKI
jgi:molybdopterin synthase catalytic subunit